MGSTIHVNKINLKMSKNKRVFIKQINFWLLQLIIRVGHAFPVFFQPLQTIAIVERQQQSCFRPKGSDFICKRGEVCANKVFTGRRYCYLCWFFLGWSLFLRTNVGWVKYHHHRHSSLLSRIFNEKKEEKFRNKRRRICLLWIRYLIFELN